MCDATNTTGRLNKVQALAGHLHEAFCTSNHTDQCTWWYEVSSLKDPDLAASHDWNGHSHAFWVKQAQKVLGMGYPSEYGRAKEQAEAIAFGAIELLKIRSAFTRDNIEWAGLDWKSTKEWFAAETARRKQIEREERARIAAEKAAVQAQIAELQKKLESL